MAPWLTVARTPRDARSLLQGGRCETWPRVSCDPGSL